MRRELVVLTVVLMLVGITMAAQGGPESASSSGWAVTTNHHGEDILIGDLVSGLVTLEVQVLVGDDADHYDRLSHVIIQLRDETDGVVAWVNYTREELDQIGDGWLPGLAPNGRLILSAWTDPVDEWPDDPMNPDEWDVGHYSVKVLFYAEEGKNLANDDDREAMRATTQMVVPEAPTGTLAVLLAMFAGLAIFAKKRS